MRLGGVLRSRRPLFERPKTKAQKNRLLSEPVVFLAGLVAIAATAAVAAAATSAAATTAAVAATAAAATTTAAAAAATAASAFTRAGLVDDERSATDAAAIDRCDGLRRFIFGRHFDESESAGLARFAVHNDLSAADVADFSEKVAERLVVCIVAEIAYGKFGCHDLYCS